MKKKPVVKKKVSNGDWYCWRPQMPIVFVNHDTKQVGIYYPLGTSENNHPSSLKVRGLDK